VPIRGRRRAKAVSAKPWLFSSGETITSGLGKAFGVLSLLSAARWHD
jgi:hypothetical protein